MAVPDAADIVCADLTTGRWRGTLVAIKVVEHVPSADLLSKANNIEREALLATSLSHPNVITTFKVSTMLASTAQALRSAGSADAEWTAAEVAHVPQLPHQPSSSTVDEGSIRRGSDTLHHSVSAESGPSCAAATPRDSAMSKHGGDGMHVPQTPFLHDVAGGPAAGDLHGSTSTAYVRERSSSSSRDDFRAAAVLGIRAALDSAAGNAGRHPALSLAEEGGYSQSPEEMAAEDDPAEVQERCACVAGVFIQSPWLRTTTPGASLSVVTCHKGCRVRGFCSHAARLGDGGRSSTGDHGHLLHAYTTTEISCRDGARQLRLLETWCLMEYAERGSLADSLRRHRLLRANTGTPDLAVIVQCLQDIASGVLLPRLPALKLPLQLNMST